MLNFALCDDNELALDKLKKMLDSIFVKNDIEANISFMCETPSDLLNYIKENIVDVLLLDIDLKDKISGVDLANKIRELPTITRDAPPATFPNVKLGCDCAIVPYKAVDA